MKIAEYTKGKRTAGKFTKLIYTYKKHNGETPFY